MLTSIWSRVVSEDLCEEGEIRKERWKEVYKGENKRILKFSTTNGSPHGHYISVPGPP